MTIHDLINNALTIDQCKQLPTPRLLTYFKKNRGLNWIGVCGCCGETLNEEDEYKNKIAGAYMDQIKAILNTREHVPSKRLKTA